MDFKEDSFLHVGSISWPIFELIISGRKWRTSLRQNMKTTKRKYYAYHVMWSHYQVLRLISSLFLQYSRLKWTDAHMNITLRYHLGYITLCVSFNIYIYTLSVLYHTIHISQTVYHSVYYIPQHINICVYHLVYNITQYIDICVYHSVYYITKCISIYISIYHSVYKIIQYIYTTWNKWSNGKQGKGFHRNIRVNVS